MIRKSSSLPRSRCSSTLLANESLKYLWFHLNSGFSLIAEFLSLQVLLPLIDQTFKNHCLYFLSTPSKNLSSCGCASNKEKEMVTRYFAEAIHNLYYQFIHCLVFAGYRGLLLYIISFLFYQWRELIKCISYIRPFLFPCSYFAFSSSFFLSGAFCSVLCLLSIFSSLFCKLAALVRHRISLFGKVDIAPVCIFMWLLALNPFISTVYFAGSDSAMVVSCLLILTHSLDTR